MTFRPLLSLALSALAVAGLAAADVAYEFVPNALTPPPGKETIGNGHGEIAVDSAGNIYVGELTGRSWERYATGPVPKKRRVIHKLVKVAG